MSLHRRSFWAPFAFGLFITEVLIATVWAGVPFVRADLGDYLVVILLYAVAKAAKPSLRALPLALCVFSMGVAIECAQWLGLADRLGFPRGSLLSVVIGTTFQFTDLWMYAAGSLTAWLIDKPGRSASGLGARSPSTCHGTST